MDGWEDIVAPWDGYLAAFDAHLKAKSELELAATRGLMVAAAPVTLSEECECLRCEPRSIESLLSLLRSYDRPGDIARRTRRSRA